MKPINVCFVAHYSAGGSAISLSTLLSSLDRRRFSPIVVFHRIKEDTSAVDALKAAGVPVFSLIEPDQTKATVINVNVTGWLAASEQRSKLLEMHHLGRSMREVIRRDIKWLNPLHRFLKSHPIDVLHFNNGLRHHRPDLMLASQLDLPVVCHVRNFQTLTPLERYLGRNVKRFLYISRAIANSYEDQKIAPQRGQIIHNAVTLSPPLSEPERLMVRSELGLTGDQFVLANVGRLVAWKGQDVFIKSVARLSKQIPNLRALIIGKADDNPGSRAFVQQLRNMVAELGLTERIIFTGFRPDVNCLMGAADVVVHSATTAEPFGRVIIEGMAARTAVIAANDGGTVDIIEPGKTGLLVTPGDDTALSEAVVLLYRDPAFRAAMRDAGYQYAINNFSAAAHAAQVQESLLACLN